MSNRKRVLITGAAGRIGATLAEGLKERYDLRLQYHRTIPEQKPVKDFAIADVSNFDQVAPLLEGMNAVVHMAADPRVNAPWDSILDANIVGTYNVYEAARRAGCNKVVFASSNHATGYYEKEGAYTTPEMPVRPDSYYGVSKVFGEALGRYYADEHGMSVVCLRIGSFQPKPRGARQLATWLSHRDTVQLVWRAIEADVKYVLAYGISGNTRAYWDLTRAREQLGYAPEDNAEDYAEEVLAEQARRDAERRTSGSG